MTLFKKIIPLLLLLVLISPTMLINNPIPQAHADAFSSIKVQVGYADDLRASPFFPAPWAGDPSVIFIGSGSPFDAGAVRIINTGSSSITLDSVVVDLNRPGPIFSLWGSFTIPAGMSAVLTQTISTPVFNFDTSDFPITACGTEAASGTNDPIVSIKIGGSTQAYDDSAHVLDTGGFDLVCLDGGTHNESLQWRDIGTTGVGNPGGQSLTITAPPNISVNTDPNLCSAAPSLGTATTTGGVGTVTVTSNPASGTSFPLGTTSVTWTATDSATPTPNTVTATQTVTVTDNQPPTITAPPAVTVQLGASSSTIGIATTSDNCPGVTFTNDAPATFSTAGTVTVTWTATDSSGNKASATQLVTVNAPPDCSKAAASSPMLWPPNHKMQNINIIGVTDPDGGKVSIMINSILQDEPVTGGGSGHAAPDGSGVGTDTAQVRAERAGTADGRTYNIGFGADDGQGGVCTGTVLVVVPHDQSAQHPEVDQGALYDSTIP